MSKYFEHCRATCHEKRVNHRAALINRFFRLTNLEYLGNDMTEAGNEFGVNTPYGSALIRVGQTEQR